MKKYERVFASIDLSAVKENYRNLLGGLSLETKAIAVVKADGYGHGAVQVAHTLDGEKNLWGFAAATAEEAIELRESGIDKPLLILGYVFPEYYRELVGMRIRPAIFSIEAARDFSRAASKAGRTAPIHIAVDTGMSRIGFREPEKFAAILKEIADLPNLTIEGIFTHFARADEDRTEPIINQAALFKDFLRAAEEAGIVVPLRHCSNSAASLRHWDEDSDAVRLGISLYGVYPSDETKKDAAALRPAMELKSRIVHLKTVEPGTPVGYGGTFITERKTRIATIPVGYADGYPRGLSNKGSVIIRGRRAKIIGRICMDQFMADVTDIPEVSPFDEVTLLGRGGDDFISVEELSELSGRFPYEFLCCIGKRVPRVYKNG